MSDQPPENDRETGIKIDLTIQEFHLPLVRDALVLGVRSPIGPHAIAKVLNFLHVQPFRQIKTKVPGIVDSIFIRESLLGKVEEGKIRDFILTRVAPLMNPEDILKIDLRVAVTIQGSL